MTARPVASARVASYQAALWESADPTPDRGVVPDPDTNEGQSRGGAPTRLRVGSSRCACAQCGRRFGGVVSFDRHQLLTDDGVVCLGDEDLHRKGLRLVDGWWGRPYVGGGSTPRSGRGAGR